MKKTKPSPADKANAARNAALVFTSDEWTLARAGWTNVPYGEKTRLKKNLDFPRGVWTHPRHPGPHSLAVALLADLPDDPNGKPFADAESLADVRHAERAEKKAAKEREREEIRAESAARAEARRIENSLR